MHWTPPSPHSSIALRSFKLTQNIRPATSLKEQEHRGTRGHWRKAAEQNQLPEKWKLEDTLPSEQGNFTTDWNHFCLSTSPVTPFTSRQIYFAQAQVHLYPERLPALQLAVRTACMHLQL